MDNPAKKQIRGFLEAHGQVLIDNGYNIVPIEPGKKGPIDEDWQKGQSTASTLNHWLADGRKDHGIGILTKRNPAVDIDVPDVDFAMELESKAIELWGEAPIRVGNAPKRLLVYRTNDPFPKITSKTYLNEWQERCRIEILCDGQQFVAFHIHKDTGKPYVWITKDSPLNVESGDLPKFDEEKVLDLITMFEEGAEERGWKEAKGSLMRRQAKAGEIDRNDPFAADSHPIELTQVELQKRLMMVPGADDYDTWLQIGMCLYHQYDGAEIGKEMWHEWSESANNYDQEALDRKWDTFDISDKRRAPVTARLILRLAKEAAESQAIETAQDLRDKFGQAKDRTEWNEIAKLTRSAEIDHLTRASLAEVARDRLTIITGAKVPLAEVKKTLAFEINTKEMPRWARDWVYDSTDDRFYHTVSKITVSVQGFNAINDRHSMTKKDILEGKPAQSSAGQLALNVYKVPVVNGRMYAPGRDAIFIYNDATMANTYPENQVPLKPKVIRPIDTANIKRVKHHLKHLLESAEERRMLIDWLAYVVQNPGKRVHYAPVLQGVQGDGKSFFAFLLAAVMGRPNVRMGNAHILEGAFTGWAEGQCVMAIEEIRLVGHNRYDVLNRVKPFITNPIIEIHPKGRDPYNVENTTNYLLFTNYRDAMPISENERRFLVLFSRWQTSEALREFKLANPDYYINLYGALDDSAQALRYWLLQWELSENFAPQGDAPITGAMMHMVNAAMTPEVRGIRELIDSKEFPDISDTLLNITRLAGLEMTHDIEIPQKKSLEKMLEIAGFWPLGRIRVGASMQRFYSKTPHLFQSPDGNGGWNTSAVAIRKWLDENLPPEEEEDF